MQGSVLTYEQLLVGLQLTMQKEGAFQLLCKAI